MKRKILSIILAMVLVLSLIPISGLAAFTDVQNHWAQEAIDKWSDLGIINGSGGNFRPADPITRGEMAVIINRLMKYQTAAPNTFTDLEQDFYTDAILKASAAGIITGYNGLVRPKANITKEEAVVMLSRAFGLIETTAASEFNDSASVSSWAKGYVNAMAAKGYIHGSGGEFNPRDSIKRAEIVAILDNAITGLYTEAKEYTGNVSGIAIVNTSGAVLKDMTITGDLIIAEGVGSGEVTLTNVKVTGNTIVRGGGPNSIVINGSSELNNLIIEKTDDGKIRIVKEDGTVVDAVYIDDGNDEIILKGSFKSVTISAEITLRIAANSTIDELIIEDTATKSRIINEGKITQAFISDHLVDGKDADDVTFEGIQPLKISPLVAVVGDNDKPSGGGGLPTTVDVTGITADKTDLVLVKGGATGTIVATVSPSNATNKAVTWTSSVPAVATVANGVVTPLEGGTTVITATTANGKTASTTVTVADMLVSSGSIQAVINTAAAGDIILVAAGLYPEELTINKSVILLSQEYHLARITGSITIQNVDGVTINGFEVNANATYTTQPVIHIINSTGIKIFDNIINATTASAQLSIGTSTGPARVTGRISGNTVYGAIGLGTEGKLSVTNNTVSYASNEGLWFYPVGASAELEITGNRISGFAALTGGTGSAAIKVESRPESINSITDDLAMEAAIKAENFDATVKLTWIKTVDDAAALASAINSVNVGDVIVVAGDCGDSENFTLYEITKPITVIGVGTSAPKIFGTFHVYTDGVSFKNLAIHNRGGSPGNQAEKAAIDVLAKQVSIIECDFIMGVDVPDGYVANGVTIWPLGSGVFNLELSGNIFTGYGADTDTWSSCAFQIVENISIDTTRFTKAVATYGASPKTDEIDTTTEYLSEAAIANDYAHCSNNFIYHDWANYPLNYKFVYATNAQTLVSGVEGSADGAIVLLAAGTYELTSTVTLTANKVNLIGAGNDQTIIQYNSAAVQGNGLFAVPVNSGQNGKISFSKVGFENISADVVKGNYVFLSFPGTNANEALFDNCSFDNFYTIAYFNNTQSGQVNNNNITITNCVIDNTAWVYSQDDITSGSRPMLPDNVIISGNTGNSALNGKEDFGGVTLRSSSQEAKDRYTEIQAAVNAAATGDIITVAAGIYQEDVIVNKDNITITGAGFSKTSIIGTTGNTTPLSFGANNATVSGFTITHQYTDTELSAWTFNNNGVIFMQGKTGNTLSDCYIMLNRNGIYLNNCQSNIVRDNFISNNRTGINMCNNISNTQIIGNTISSNWTIGLVFYDNNIAANLSTVIVTGNTFDENWYSEVLVKDSAASTPLVSTGVLDVTGNTFTDDPVTYTTSVDASLNEPAFAEQKPYVLGGSATKPSQDLPTLRNINNGTAVVRYDGKVLNVGTEPGSFSTITAAITAATSGDTICIALGIYDEIVTITNKSLTIIGAGNEETKVKAFSAYTGTGNTLTIRNLTVYGNNGTGQASAGVFISTGTVVVENCNIIVDTGLGADATKRGIETEYNNAANIIIRNCSISGYKSPYFNPSTGSLSLDGNAFNAIGPSIDPPYGLVTLMNNNGLSVGLFIGYNLLDDTNDTVLAGLSDEVKELAIAIHQNNPDAVVKLCTNSEDGSVWGGFYTAVENGKLVITGHYLTAG